MVGVHKQVWQAAAIVFCDASYIFIGQVYNTALFILSTIHVCSGVPLAAVIVSDETEQTVTKAMDIWLSKSCLLMPSMVMDHISLFFIYENFALYFQELNARTT